MIQSLIREKSYEAIQAIIQQFFPLKTKSKISWLPKNEHLSEGYTVKKKRNWIHFMEF